MYIGLVWFGNTNKHFHKDFLHIILYKHTDSDVYFVIDIFYSE